ncbi:hypothetical protein ACFL1D_04625 [Candidatus Omnitrophota bacterium]
MKKKKYEKPKLSIKKMSRFFFNCSSKAACSTQTANPGQAGNSLGTCRC